MKTNKSIFLLILFLFPAVASFAQWDNVSRYPSTATDGAFSFSMNGKGYVGGGLYNNGFYSYDPATNKWTKLKDVPSDGAHLTWAMAFSMNGKGYVVGGSYKDLPDLTDAVWEYDPAADSWTQKANYPGGPRDGGFAAVIGSKAYVGCGFDGQNVVSDAYTYDPGTDKWTAIANYGGGPDIFPAAFSLGGMAYVGTGGANTEIQDFYAYDPQQDLWIQKSSFPGDPRQTAVAFTDGTYGYIGGGMAGYNTNRKDFWRYDPSNDTWVKLQSSFPTNYVAWGTAFAIDRIAYIGMGADVPSFAYTNSFYKRDFSTAASIDKPKPHEELKLSPSPVANTLQISLSQTFPMRQVLIFDLCGRLVKQYTPGFSAGTLDVHDLKEGIYTIYVRTDEGLYTDKIVKQ